MGRLSKENNGANFAQLFTFNRASNRLDVIFNVSFKTGIREQGLYRVIIFIFLGKRVRNK